MDHSFWTGFEKQAKPAPGKALNYAVMRAEEIAKKRIKQSPPLNYAAMPKRVPKILPKALPEVVKTPAEILKDRAKGVASGGLSHSQWQEIVPKK